MTDREALAAVLARSDQSAVVHAAGVLDDGVVADLTPERLAGVLAPKADRRLAPARADGRWTCGVCAVLLASPACSATPVREYAAANAFLDGLAAHPPALGLPAVSLAWGLWANAERDGRVR